MSAAMTVGWAVGMGGLNDESDVVMVTLTQPTIGLTPDAAVEMAKLLLLMAEKVKAYNATGSAA